jgi:uncharacterized protein (TIGR03083 family)
MTTFDELVAIDCGVLDDAADLGAGLDSEQWITPTACTGWTVADMVAHLIDIEQVLLGDPRPDHEPDWDSLPWVDRDLSRFTEIGVDARRGRPQADVIAELRATTERRMAQLEAGPHDLETLVPGFFGKQTPLGRQLSRRIFDSWVHLQDMRTALGIADGWDSIAARVTRGQLIDGADHAWENLAKAPRDAVRIELTDIGETVVLGESPEVTTISMTWPDFFARTCGRVEADDPAWVARVRIEGDFDLAARLLSGIAVTP